MKYIFYLTLILGLSFLNLSSGFSEDTVPSNAPQATSPISNDMKIPPITRSKDLRFDEAVVEGMNSSSKDSLENSESRKNANAKHLYRKRTNYRSEIQLFPSSLEFAP